MHILAGAEHAEGAFCGVMTGRLEGERSLESTSPFYISGRGIGAFEAFVVGFCNWYSFSLLISWGIFAPSLNIVDVTCDVPKQAYGALSQ